MALSTKASLSTKATGAWYFVTATVLLFSCWVDFASAACSAVNCATQKSLCNATSDGQYVLTVNDRALSVFCAAMASATPREYITLVNTDSNPTVHVSNYAMFGADASTTITTIYNKVRLQLQPLAVDTNDLTFAVSRTLCSNGTCNTPLPVCSGNNAVGQANVDLRGTPLAVDLSKTTESWGANAFGTCNTSSDGQVTDCDGAGPKCGNLDVKFIPATSCLQHHEWGSTADGRYQIFLADDLVTVSCTNMSSAAPVQKFIAGGSSGPSKTTLIIAIVVSLGSVGMIGKAVLLWLYLRRRERRKREADAEFTATNTTPSNVTSEDAEHGKGGLSMPSNMAMGSCDSTFAGAAVCNMSSDEWLRWLHTTSAAPGASTKAWTSMSLLSAKASRALRKSKNFTTEWSQDANSELLMDVTPAGLVGDGCLGQVRYGAYNGMPVAIKVVPLNRQFAEWNQTTRIAKASMQDFGQEAHLINVLAHPHVARIYACRINTSILAVAQDSFTESLSQRLSKANKPLPLRQLVSVALDVARALSVLHPNVIHRDLRPQVVLFTDGNVLKVADFGIARVLLAMTQRGDRSVVTSVVYSAPEVLANRPDKITSKADVYSLGMIMWHMLTGREPWVDQPLAAIQDHIVKGFRPPLPDVKDSVPQDLLDLIKACWQQDPAQRPDAQAVIDWLQGVERQLQSAPAAPIQVVVVDAVQE